MEFVDLEDFLMQAEFFGFPRSLARSSRGRMQRYRRIQKVRDKQLLMHQYKHKTRRNVMAFRRVKVNLNGSY